MKKIISILIVFLSCFISANDITVSQDTLMQTLTYGETIDRTITITNNTANDVGLSITLVDQTWIPLGRLALFGEFELENETTSLGFSPDLTCGTPDPTSEELLITIDQVERWLERQDRSSRNIINVQIAWHVIHAVNGVGSLSYNQIAEQVTWLNNAFADHDFVFTLASVDYTANDNWFTNMYSLDSQVKSQLYIDPYHYMNVYTASIFSEGVAGYAYLPNQWPEGSYNHGIVLDYRTLPYAGGYDGDTATHETGHYLGLNHTFLGNCTVTNDGVEDTPAHHEDYLWQCNNNLDSCVDLPGNDPVHNYMTYTSNTCQWEFTLGQKDRMHAMISQYRPGLLENPVAPLWMTVADEAVTVPANGTFDINFTFDATNTFGGTYYGDAIFTADSLDTSITVSATLNVYGFPEIGLETASILFGDAFVSDTSFISFEITNVGSDDLEISSFEFDNNYFYTDVTTLSIEPSESYDLNLYFIPDSIGLFVGNMTIYSNDETDQEVTVSLNGEGVLSPLSLSFSALSDTLAPNSYSAHILTITNTGNESIDYEITHEIDWLTIDNESGTIPATNTQLVQMNINTLFMNYGEYSGDIIISSNVGQFLVEITVVVAALAMENEVPDIPQTFKVHENFPNPFNPITRIYIEVPRQGSLSIQVHDVSGRLIKVLSSKHVKPGYYDFIWEGKNELGESVASGVYILYVQLNGQYRSQKMLLVK